MTTPDDITVFNDAIRCFEKATGARLNIIKPQASAVGTLDTSSKVLNIQYSDEIKVFNFRLKNSIAQSRVSSSARITNTIRTQAIDAYSRNLGMAQRIKCVHVYLLAKLWHTVQIFTPPEECVQQIVKAMAWYIWRGAIFRVPVSTLQRRKDERGWGLIDVAAKCRALLLTRFWTQGRRERSVSAEWQKYWKLQKHVANPQHVGWIPPTLIYLRIYALEMAYIVPPRQSEKPRAFRRRVYGTIRTISMANTKPTDMRITKLHPTTEWTSVWPNLHTKRASDAMKANWYMVIHGIIPTKEMLHAIVSRTPPNAGHVAITTQASTE
jgi:hypothetical protein